MLEMKSLQEEPVEGFKITLVDEADLYNWEVAIFGPPNTHYEGGYFKVRSLLHCQQKDLRWTQEEWKIQWMISDACMHASFGVWKSI